MSLNIYYLSASIIPSNFANSIHVLKMAAGWKAQGHDITVFVTGKPIREDEVKSQYGLSDVPNIIWSGCPNPAKINGIKNAFFVRSQLTEAPHPPNLIYARNQLALAAAVSLNIPFIYEFHTIPRRWAQRHLDRWILKHENCIGIVSITKALQSDILEIYPEAKNRNMIVAPDGADLPAPSQRQFTTWSGRPSALQVGYVGSLYPGKGAETLPLLAEQMNDIDFHIVGGNDKDVRRLSAQRSLPNLYFHGHVSHGKLTPFFEKFDVLIAPLQNRVALLDKKIDIVRWTSPLKIFEYMSHKKPIIASDISVLKEILKNNHNALLCRPDHLEDWVGAINKLRNRKLRVVLSDTAFREFSEKYTWSARCSLILNSFGFS